MATPSSDATMILQPKSCGGGLTTAVRRDALQVETRVTGRFEQGGETLVVFWTSA